MGCLGPQSTHAEPEAGVDSGLLRWWWQGYPRPLPIPHCQGDLRPFTLKEISHGMRYTSSGRDRGTLAENCQSQEVNPPQDSGKVVVCSFVFSPGSRGSHQERRACSAVPGHGPPPFHCLSRDLSTLPRAEKEKTPEGSLDPQH